MRTIDEEKFEEIINNEVDESNAIVQKVVLPENKSNIEIFIKREDLLHQTLSGNKWRKLKYNLIEAFKLGKDTILTFGGAYSNHIYAAASAGNIFGFSTIGIIRGEEHLPLNPTLDFAKSKGMNIYYVDRRTYRYKSDEKFIDELRTKFGNFYLLPEGGSNRFAVNGCSEIIHNMDIEPDYILSACGTGGTLAGIICGLKGKSEVIGIPVLKGGHFLHSAIENHIKDFSKTSYSNWRLNLNYHFGGYAKIDRDLISFIRNFQRINGIELDYIYTGKLLYAINSMIKKGEFREGSKILAIHTGGLQGNMGIQKSVDKLLS
jgi:1-aminocyclopropane-1-carboxylate deaminase/D-cysteine desulfhydrase-like pyridoxal-dependent ACC family enzyme